MYSFIGSGKIMPDLFAVHWFEYIRDPFKSKGIRYLGTIGP